MSDMRLLYDAFNIYYEKGMTALKDGKYEVAKRNIYSAAESLLKLAKLSQGALKTQRLKRASELMELANKISMKQEKVASTIGEAINENVDINNVSATNVEDASLDASMDKLSKLIGLYNVKTQISDWVEQIKVFKLREAQGLSVPPMSYHLIFTGNPGTGKTTVARIIAQIYYAMGITKSPNFVEIDRADLVAGYVGQTAIKTKEVINKAKGGVLFIDEAYTLANRGNQDFGQEAIDTLLKAMEDQRDSLVVIAAGYDNLMKSFIDSNPGLKSRFKTFISFKDYTAEELYDIFIGFCKAEEYILEDEADTLLKQIVLDMYNNRNEEFGNGRDMRNLFEMIVTNQSRRVALIDNPSREDLMSIKKVDLPQIETSDFEKKNYSELDLKNVHTNSSFINHEFISNGNSLGLNELISQDDLKEEIKKKIIIPLNNPNAFIGYQKKIPSGLLLYGPLGVEKRGIAEAIANDINAQFYSLNSEDLLHMTCEKAIEEIRRITNQATEVSKATLYIEDIDLIAPKNSKNINIIMLRNELLAVLKSIESRKDIDHTLLLIASTSKPWDIDPSFINPSILDNVAYIGLPDDIQREEIISDRLSKLKKSGVVTLDNDIDVDMIVNNTNAYSELDLKNVLDKAEEYSINRSISEGNKYIMHEDFKNALSIVKTTVQRADIEKLMEWNNGN